MTFAHKHETFRRARMHKQGQTHVQHDKWIVSMAQAVLSNKSWYGFSRGKKTMWQETATFFRPPTMFFTHCLRTEPENGSGSVTCNQTPSQGRACMCVFVRCRDQVHSSLKSSFLELWCAVGWGAEAAVPWPSLLCVFWCWRLIRCDSESPTLQAHGTSKDGGTEGGRVRGERERENKEAGEMIVIEQDGWKANNCWELKCHRAQRRDQPHASKDTETIFPWWIVCVYGCELRVWVDVWVLRWWCLLCGGMREIWGLAWDLSPWIRVRLSGQHVTRHVSSTCDRDLALCRSHRLWFSLAQIHVLQLAREQIRTMQAALVGLLSYKWECHSHFKSPCHRIQIMDSSHPEIWQFCC